MESQDDRVIGATQAEYLFLRARLALAAAIIKSKPRGVSGRQHAEDLAAMLERQDEGWKKKAQELQQEVLRLRQEVLISRVTSDAKNSTEAAAHDDTVDISSQDLFGPESVGFSADLQLDSDSETPDLLLDHLQPATTPSDQQPPQPSVPFSADGGPRGTASLPHVHFLQSLCSLHRVEESSRGLESLWFHPDGGVDSVLVDSVCQLLDSVVAACRDPLPPLPGPCDFVLEACGVAARAMELFCSQRLPSVEFMRRVEQPLRELTGMLLHRNQHSGLRAAERLMEYLITLGSCSMSQAFLIRHILSQISAVADQLWQAVQEPKTSGLEKFPVDQYQNSCYLFWIVEELLQKSKVPHRVEEGSEQMGFLSHLEQRVFQLSREFPLFSICMWRMGRLLASSDRYDT